MLQDEYYVIDRENNDNYPLLTWDQSESEYGFGKPAENIKPVEFRLGEPIPKKFELVDYHKAPEPVVSKRIVDALMPLDLYGVQFVPAKVRYHKDPFMELPDYWFLHVWNRISCLDKDESELDLYSDGMIFGINKLVLDEKTLSMFDLPKRSMFALSEDISVLLVHESVKDAIESVQPRGVRFFKATEWNSDICFED